MPNVHDRVGVALEILSRELAPYAVNQIQIAYGDRWEDAIRSSLRGTVANRPDPLKWDAQTVLVVMWEHWNEAFRQKLGLFERSLVSELREFRNRWAHQSGFTDDDGFRVLDSAERLLKSTGFEAAANEIHSTKNEVLYERFQQRQQAVSPKQRQRQLYDVLVFAICATTIISSAMIVLGKANLPATILFCGFVLFAFGYLAYQRLTISTPLFGIHECHHCRRIIYSEICPYCDR